MLYYKDVLIISRVGYYLLESVYNDVVFDLQGYRHKVSAQCYGQGAGLPLHKANKFLGIN